MVSDADSGTHAGALVLRLNPCSNGIWSLTLFLHYGRPQLSLNPCSNGIWSLTKTKGTHGFSTLVLILVLMDYGL